MGKNIDWSNLGFGYVKTDYRYVSNFKNGAWDEGTLSTDDMVTISECACVLQYAQTVFEGMKAYTTEDGHIVVFRPDLNAERMENSAKRLEMPVFPKDRSHGIQAAGKRFPCRCLSWNRTGTEPSCTDSASQQTTVPVKEPVCCQLSKRCRRYHRLLPERYPDPSSYR